MEIYSIGECTKCASHIYQITKARLRLHAKG